MKRAGAIALASLLRMPRCWGWLGAVLVGLSVWCLAMLMVRLAITGPAPFFYLAWNLFLAWLPIGLAALVWRLAVARRRIGWGGGMLAVAWLLFFPNAHYLVTDLIHLRPRPPIPLWFDGALLVMLAWLGMFLGAASLGIMRDLVARLISRAWSWALVVAVSFAAGFGVYLGRFERWNSWDIVHRPGSLLAQVGAVLAHPFEYAEPWAFTLQFGGFILLSYLLLHWLWFRLQGPGRPSR